MNTKKKLFITVICMRVASVVCRVLSVFSSSCIDHCVILAEMVLPESVLLSDRMVAFTLHRRIRFFGLAPNLMAPAPGTLVPIL